MRTVLAAIRRWTTLVIVVCCTTAGAADPSLKSVPIADFRRLEIGGTATVTLVQGDRTDLSVDASPETRARIYIENRDGALSIRVAERKPEWTWHDGTRASPRLTVTFRDLEALRLSGLVKVEAARIATTALDIEAGGATQLRIGALQATRLRIEGSGAFQADIAGRVIEQQIEISGAGQLRAGDLASDIAAVEVSGAGKVLLRAGKKLDIRVSGAGNVEYLGEPRVTQDVSGAARVRRRESSSMKEPLPHIPAIANARTFCATGPRVACNGGIPPLQATSAYESSCSTGRIPA